MGAERELVMGLMMKWATMKRDGQPMFLKSAVCRDAVKGHIYVEAYKVGSAALGFASSHALTSLLNLIRWTM